MRCYSKYPVTVTVTESIPGPQGLSESPNLLPQCGDGVPAGHADFFDHHKSPMRMAPVERLERVERIEGIEHIERIELKEVIERIERIELIKRIKRLERY